MNPSLPSILARMVRKFELRSPLDDSDREALLGLPFRVQELDRGKFVTREGQASTASALLLSGYAIRHKLTVDGDRQIVSFHVPGDFVDLEASLLRVSDHNVQTVTRCEFAFVAVTAVRELLDHHPAIARAVWVDTLVDSSIFREWVLNIGRRDARARIAHILCEFARRLEVAGLGSTSGYELPFTQEQLADATGLTSVHVNRTLKSLEAEGLITRNKAFVGFPNWDRLRAVAGFSDLYLHLDQVAA